MVDKIGINRSYTENWRKFWISNCGMDIRCRLKRNN